jgi:hypothetical protein
MLRDPLSHLEGVDISMFFAANRDTASRIRRLGPGIEAWDPLTLEKGDTLAPYGQTLRWLGPAGAPRAVRFEAPCEPHAYMLNDPTVVTRVRRRLA